MFKKPFTKMSSAKNIILFFSLFLGAVLLFPHLGFSCNTCINLSSLNLAKKVCSSTFNISPNAEVSDQVDEWIASRQGVLDMENAFTMQGNSKKISVVPIKNQVLYQDGHRASDYLVYLQQSEEEHIFIAHIPQPGEAEGFAIKLTFPRGQTISLPLLPLMTNLVFPAEQNFCSINDESGTTAESNPSISPTDYWHYGCYYLVYRAVMDFIDCVAGYTPDCSSAVAYALAFYIICT